MRGITLIEILLVVAIFGIISVSSTPFLSSFMTRNNYQVARDRVISEIYKAQSYAMDGKVVDGSKVWGVCITGNVFRMFNGSCEFPNYKEDFSFPGGVVVSGIVSMTFGNSRGEPVPAGTINVVSVLGTSGVTVNGAGMVEAN